MLCVVTVRWVVWLMGCLLGGWWVVLLMGICCTL